MTDKAILVASDLQGAAWFKSSYSGTDQSQCVEVADMRTTPYAALVVRDSKNPHGPALMFLPTSFAWFISDVLGERFDA